MREDRRGYRRSDRGYLCVYKCRPPASAPDSRPGTVGPRHHGVSPYRPDTQSACVIMSPYRPDTQSACVIMSPYRPDTLSACVIMSPYRPDTLSACVILPNSPGRCGRVLVIRKSGHFLN